MYDRAVSKGQLRPGIDVAGLIEWVVRILLSYMMIPSPSVTGTDDYRRIFRTYLAPALRLDHAGDSTTGQ